MRKFKAFTLFEIIIAMLVVGILSALAAPKVVDLVNEARRGDELNTVGNVRSGIALTYLGNVTRGITPQYPQNLDNATLAKASPTNPVYDLVLQHGITKSWEKLEPLRYRGPTGQEYEYDPTDGSFEAVAALPPPPPPSLITWAYPGTQITSGGLVANNVATQVSTQYFITSIATLKEAEAPFIESDPGTLWQDGVYGIDGWDYLSFAQQTADGGYLLAGSTWSGGPENNDDAYLVKIDSEGNLEWSRTYAGIGGESIYSFLQTPDGYMILGWTDSFGAGGGDYFVSKIDSTGTIQWSNTYGESGTEIPWRLEQDLDGNYLITGYTTSFGAGSYDANLTKINQDGNLLWSKTYGESNQDFGGAIQQTSDGGYIMTASTSSFGAGGMDQALIKMNSDGNIQWAKTYGGGSNEWDFSVVETADGYMISGMTYSFGGADSYLTKVDSEGNLQWSKTYGGASADDWAGSISLQPTTDGNYVISSNRTVSLDPYDEDFYLAKITSDGNIVWDKTYGGSDYEENWGLVSSSDGGYLVAGYTMSFGTGEMDFYTVKTDSDGNVIQ